MLAGKSLINFWIWASAYEFKVGHVFDYSFVKRGTSWKIGAEI
jgi:hypothetical protein